MQGFTSLLGKGHSRHSSEERNTPGTQTTMNGEESKGEKEHEKERAEEKKRIQVALRTTCEIY